MPKHYRPAGKKKEGNAARYITRTHAVKQLQISLTLFRKLCILKGIFPREPKKKVKGGHHTYYHTKDIAFLHHEPLVEKFRDIRSYSKKIKKAEAKKNKERAISLRSRQPTYELGRLIRERYPKFIDALRDLDDCLSLVHLFAALPAVHREKIEVKRIHTCRRLSHEWQAYISRTHKLRKTFVSVKGIYYQAEVEGQKVTWLTPHALQQVVPDDIDYNVMLTFLEFYETLQSSINARLYHSLNLDYPPTLDSRLEALAAELYALSRYIDSSSRPSVELQGINSSEPNQDEAEKKGHEAEESELRLSQLQSQLPSNKPGALMHLVEDADNQDEDDEDTRECKKLFKDMKFFLSREVPRESLLFVIPAFGGTVSWEGDGAPFKESDQSITYQIVDRPTQGHIFLSRNYVQPQWVFDCVNTRIILPTEDYMVGRVPPPHLSPFVDNEAEGYFPDYAEKLKTLKAAARTEVLLFPGLGKEDLDDPQSLLSEGIKNRTEANEAADRKRKMMLLEKQYHEELKMELQGAKHSSAADVGEKNEDTEVKEDIVLPDLDQVAQDTANMSKVLMSRKKRGLLESIEIGQKRGQDRVNLLKKRKKQLASGETGEEQKQVEVEEQKSGKKKKSKAQKSSRD